MDGPSSRYPVMRSIFVTGLFQIIGGMTFFFSGLVLVIMRFDDAFRNRLENPVCGVWAGGFLVVIGIIGVLASGRPGPMRIVYPVMSLLSTPAVVVTTVISAAGAANNIHFHADHPGYLKDESFEQNEMTIAKMAFQLLICFVGVIMLTNNVLIAAFSCNAFCPGTTPKQQNNNPSSYPDVSESPAEAEAKV